MKPGSFFAAALRSRFPPNTTPTCHSLFSLSNRSRLSGHLYILQLLAFTFSDSASIFEIELAISITPVLHFLIDVISTSTFPIEVPAPWASYYREPVGEFCLSITTSTRLQIYLLFFLKKNQKIKNQAPG